MRFFARALGSWNGGLRVAKQTHLKLGKLFDDSILKKNAANLNAVKTFQLRRVFALWVIHPNGHGAVERVRSGGRSFLRASRWLNLPEFTGRGERVWVFANLIAVKIFQLQRVITLRVVNANRHGAIKHAFNQFADHF